VDTGRLKSDLDDIYDQALIFHGFTSYMRDYEMFTYCTLIHERESPQNTFTTSSSCERGVGPGVGCELRGARWGYRRTQERMVATATGR